jgi:hypothetical protein
MTEKANVVFEKIAKEEKYRGSRAYEAAANIGSLGFYGWQQNRGLMGRAATGEGLITKEEKKIAPKIKNLAGDKTYPISRLMTNPTYQAAQAAVGYALQGAQFGAAGRAVGAVLGGAAGYGGSIANRKMHSRALLGRAADKSEVVGYQEKAIIKKLKK